MITLLELVISVINVTVYCFFDKTIKLFYFHDCQNRVSTNVCVLLIMIMLPKLVVGVIELTLVCGQEVCQLSVART